jgi:hypothetical protein
MTVHYHGTPISPRAELLKLAGKNFCVSFFDPRDVDVCHQLGQSVLLDNGAYSYWTRNKGEQPFGGWYNDEYHYRGYKSSALYRQYVDWCEKWTAHRSTWCIIPDTIDAGAAGAEQNENLILCWPQSIISKAQAAPVWHVDEPVDRLLFLVTKGWPRICIGSAGRFANVGDDNWRRRMDHVFNRLCKGTGRVPVWLHMLRGMKLCRPEWGYPFASVDSTDVARNFKDGFPINIKARAENWDKDQCKSSWNPRMEQMEMEH